MPNRSLLDSILARIGKLHAGSVARRFFWAVSRARAVQEDLCAALVARAAETAFGKDRHFARIRGYTDFCANIPVHGYLDLAPYIDRVRGGETTALIPAGERVLMFALTSGTTAQPKYIPITQRVLAECRRGWNIWGLKAILDHPPSLLRHILQVTSSMHDHTAPSGVPCGAITGLLAATQKKLVRRYYTSPAAVAGIEDPTAKYYTIMRLAVARNVSWAVTASPATLLLLAKTGDEHKQQLIRDIHDGTLRGDIEVPREIRELLRPRLAADAAAARRLDAIVSRNGVLYPKDYWRLDFLAHWTGGTMGLYRSQFPRYFGSPPVRDIGLIASEGRMSIPVADETASGILAVTSHFFEFIPESDYGGRQSAVLRMHELREGENYFVLLTNASGLYRYDIGDRVRVTGWVGEAPLIEFLSRDAHTSSMTGEKLTEDQIVGAMKEVFGEFDPISDFVLAPRFGEVPWYRLYLEAADAKRRPDIAETYDLALCRVNPEYESKRKSLRLGPVEMATLPDGTLVERDRRLRVQRSRTSEQFKHQYLLASPGADRDLESRALHGKKDEPVRG